MHKAFILGASKIENYSSIADEIDADTYIICADGGYRHMRNLSLSPHLLIGDLDSLQEDMQKIDTKTIKADTDKDQTDTELALIHAVSKGIREIKLFGCLYGSLDHTYANIQLLLKYARMGIDIKLIGDQDTVFIINRPTKIKRQTERYISFFAIEGTVKNLELEGLKYPLRGYELKCGDTICVSNEFTAEHAKVSFSSGELLVIISSRKGE